MPQQLRIRSESCCICKSTGKIKVINLPKSLEETLKADPYHEMFLKLENPNWKSAYLETEECWNCDGTGVIEWEE